MRTLRRTFAQIARALLVIVALLCAGSIRAEPLPAPEPERVVAPEDQAAQLAALQAQIDDLREAILTGKNAPHACMPNALSDHGKPTMELGGPGAG